VSYFVNEIQPFRTEWHRRQDAYIKEMFEKGYSTTNIANEMNRIARRELGEYFRKLISSWGINIRIRTIYDDRGFPHSLNPTEIQKVILKERITALYSRYRKYDTLYPHFPSFTSVARFKDYIVRNYAGLKGLFRNPSDLLATDDFRRTVELIRDHERNNVDYTHTSLWNEIFDTTHPHFYKRFGLELAEIRIFAITGRLPQRFQGINFQI